MYVPCIICHNMRREDHCFQCADPSWADRLCITKWNHTQFVMWHFRFGPEDEGRIDEMHRIWTGVVFLDDRRYCLADLVWKRGDRLRYEYDLGDCW